MTDDKNFPVIFGRRGGEKIDVLSDLKSLGVIKQLKFLSIEETHLYEKKEMLLQELYHLIQNNTEIEGKILNLKRDLYNDKNIKKYLRFISDEKLLDSLNEYINLKETFKSSTEKFSIIFNKSLNESVAPLDRISTSHFLKNGLLFASHSLFNATEKNLVVSSNQLNKKQKKQIVSVLKYLSRSCSKTTPFSTFNTLFCLEKNNNGDYISTPEKIRYKYQLNNLILYYLEEALMMYESFTDHLQITSNQHLWKEEDFHFFINKKNEETLKKIGCTPILEYILSKTTEKKHTYKELTQVISEAVSETPLSVKKYLNALLEEGFLILKFPVSPDQIDWAESLQEYLTQIEDNHVKFDSLIDTLTFLETCRKTLDSFTIYEKKSKIDLCYKKMINVILSLKEDSLCSKKITPQDIFYEDVLLNSNDTILQSQYITVSNTLKKAYAYFEQLSYKKIVKRTLASFLKEKDHHKLPLLEFYQSIYLNYSTSVSIQENDLEHLRSLLSYLQDHYETLTNNEDIDLNDCLPEITSKNTNARFGAYIQFFDKSKSTIILNSFGKGNGASSSRFFNFSSKKTIDNIRTCNKTHPYTITDVKDASFHNTNIYPTLTDTTIAICQDKTSKKKQTTIPLNALYVSLDEEENLILVTKENKKIIPIQFSLESLDRKSKFAQFLDLFDPADTFGYSLYLEKINTLFLNKLKNQTLVKVPRLYLGKNIMIQRKKWFIKREDFFDIVTNEKASLAQTYYTLYHWLKKHKIPNEVFITIRAEKSTSKKTSNHKPQYMNFETPLYLVLLQDILKNSHDSDIITLTEMAPSSDHVNNTGGFVNEYIVNI